MEVGDKVTCLRGSIDRKVGSGAIGYVTGFARLSPYHPREAYISDRHPDVGGPREAWCGWFWVSDIAKAEER